MVKEMKRLSIIIAALSLLACNRFDVPEEVPFTASLESASVDTKTELNENLEVVWSADDEISVFDGTSLNDKYRVDAQSVGKSVATLVKAGGANADKGNNIDFNIAVYPYNEDIYLSKAGSGYDVCGLELPQKQYYKANSFGKNASPMIAITSSTQDKNFAFKNLCGAIKLQLTGTSRIKSISLVGNNNETLWGDFRSYTGNLKYDERDPSVSFSGKGKVLSLDCGDGVQLSDDPASFVVIVPPVTFNNGFAVLVTDVDGKQMELKTDKRQTVKRSSILKMPNVEFVGDNLHSDDEYLTFISTGDNEIALNFDSGNTAIIFEYSLNGDFWQDYKIGDGIKLSDRERLSFRAKNALTSFSKRYVSGNYYFSNRGSGTVAASGSVMSLVDPSCEATAIPCQDCFYRLFADFTTLTSAPKLPAIALTRHCYSEMFINCTSLKEAPELPATSLDEYCYEGMFEGCTALESASKLPAVYTMPYCYYRMFSGCESLKAAPELPATDISMYSYYYMFANCSALEKAPELNSNSLSTECYAHMFENCTNLRSASELPATILAPSCYDYMYRGCTSLVDAPALSATTLAEACYRGMFENCTSLKSAPQLRVPTLVRSCYAEMFRNCSSLAYIKCLASDISAYNCTGSWVEGVSASGTFVRDPHARWEDGINGIPSGWIPEAEDEAQEIDYLTFTSIGNNELSLQKTGYYIGDYLNLKYRINGGTWIDYTVGEGITLSDGDRVSFKAGEVIYRYAYNNTNHYYFTNNGSGKIAASGNIMSLLDSYCESLTITEDHCFTGLFKDFTSLVSAPELPATSLNSYCYSEMFSGCTSLETVPDLPATVLAPFCYMDMFNGCTGLVSAPAILATTQARSACSGMFSNCTSLENLSDLLADKLENYCYSGMFSGCTNLKKAPGIFAEQMKESCCFDMFYGCSSLVTPPALSASVLAESCYSRMFALCESLEEAPELPAPTLEKSCYNMMFYGCTSLRYIKCLATDISAQYCLYSWVEGVSPTGMFEKDPNAKWPRGESGIPAGWKIHGLSEDNIEAYNAWLGEWKIRHGTSAITQDTWTFLPKDEGCSFYISGIEGMDAYPVEAAYDYLNNSITVYAANDLGTYQEDGVSYNVGFYAATTQGQFFGPDAVVFTGTISDGKITIRPQQVGSVTPDYALYLFENSGKYYVLTYMSDATRLPNTLTRDGREDPYEGDGEVVTIQERGTNLDLIIMGDGFIQEDFEDGTYERLMLQAYDEFFSIEPYATIKDDFNVYYVKAVSPERILATNTGANGAMNTGHITKFSTRFTPNSTSVTGDTQLIQEYAAEAIKYNISERMLNATIVVIANQKCRAGTCHNMWYNNGYDYGQAFSISFCALGNSDEERVEILHHEICGHGFGKLADEYVQKYAYPTTAQWDVLQSQQKLGLFRNVDKFVNGNLYQQLEGAYPLTTRENVLWHDMFGTINNYESPDVESLGVYEGGNTYSYGFCRPTQDPAMSIMNYNTGIFNAISRRQIYYRYLRLSGKVTENQFGTKEELDRFLEWDREFILPKIIPTLKSARKVTPPNYVDARLPLAPPVNIVGTWEGKRFIPINQKKRVEFKQFK